MAVERCELSRQQAHNPRLVGIVQAQAEQQEAKGCPNRLNPLAAAMTERSFADLLMQRADLWASAERDSTQSVPGSILRHIDKAGKFRLPQIKAVEMHLWLKFAARNKALADIVAEGLLDDPYLAEQYRYQGRSDLSPTRKFFIAFAEENNLNALSRQARDEPATDKQWQDWLRQLLRHYPYPNRIYSLPMGAGKTYLMAAFIYLDLYFSHLMPDNASFAHNFIVLAPHAAKTAILPSLKTIRQFDPNWILPPAAAKQVKSEIHIEVLDSPRSASRSMRVRDNNLARVISLSETRDRGLVFITNAEKVVLERYDPHGSVLRHEDKKAQEETLRYNELRDTMAGIHALAVFLDEAHHTYTVTEAQEKKLRQAVEVLNSKGNLREVNGFSGTPFVNTRIDIAGHSIRLQQLQDVIYHFPLAKGIGEFLKTPKVLFKEDVREDKFIKDTLTDFFQDYDITYKDGTCSKLAIYCASIAVLNEEILPVVRDWYAARRKDKADEEVFAYYTADKKYPLPSSALADFHSLDSPHSRKRVILLVAVGREGWDCHSLTAVALPRHTTTRNFVLQTSCRCLREVSDASQEQAMIALGTGNYKLLKEQLQAVHRMTIDEFQSYQARSVPVVRRKPKLGTLAYKQVDSRCTIEINQVHSDPAKELAAFCTENDFMNLKEYRYRQRQGEGRINQAGRVISHQYSILTIGEKDPLQRYEEFLMLLQQALWGRYHAAGLNQQYGDNLQRLYQQYQQYSDWFARHPRGSVEICHAWVKAIAACFAAECEYIREELLSDVSIDLLEWQGENPVIPWKDAPFLPELEKHYRHSLTRLHKRPERIEMGMEDEGLFGYNDISFNYAPYRLDSGFEKQAILRMLQEQQLSELELYYNGLTDANLDSFNIQTPTGRYTPDFLLLQRRGGQTYQKGKKGGQAPIERVLIIETKGKPFYDDEFKSKEQFIKKTFMRHNPQFHYVSFVDEDSSGNFDIHIDKLRNTVTQWLEKTL